MTPAPYPKRLIVTNTDSDAYMKICSKSTISQIAVSTVNYVSCSRCSLQVLAAFSLGSSVSLRQGTFCLW